MAKADKKGNFIISAGEVGIYVVCPQAWYLEKVKSLSPEITPQMAEGKKEHKVWESDLNEAVIYTWASKVIILLIVILVIFYIFAKMQS